MAVAMGAWIAMEQWAHCTEMARPGIVFELRNAEGLTLTTPCVVPAPPPPFDWTSPPVVFRAIVETAPTHATPLPPPASTPQG